MKNLLLTVFLLFGITQMAFAAMNLEQSIIDCEKGGGNSCVVVGTIYENGFVKSGKKDLGMAFLFYEKACELNNAEGCKNVGYFYGNGISVKVNKTKANEFNEKACDGGDGDACYNLGIAYNEGTGKKQDFKKAQSLFSKACDMDNGGACYNMGYAYMVGKGIPKDAHKANKYFDRACDLKFGMGCFNIGVGYYNGDTKKKNLTVAGTFFKQACSLGVDKGCEIASELDPSFVASNGYNLYPAVYKKFDSKGICTIEGKGKHDTLNTMTVSFSKRLKYGKSDNEFKQIKRVVVRNSKKEIILDRTSKIFTDANNDIIAILEKYEGDKEFKIYSASTKNKNKESRHDNIKMHGYKSPTTYFIAKDKSMISLSSSTMGESTSSGMLLTVIKYFHKDNRDKPAFLEVNMAEFDANKKNITVMHIELHDLENSVKYSNIQE